MTYCRVVMKINQHYGFGSTVEYSYLIFFVHKKVELFKHPHLLLLQANNNIYKLPGGRLRPGESDVDGLKRKLLSKLSADDDNHRTKWEVDECIGTWWKSDFETLPYPYLPSSGKAPKECTKLYLVKLPSSRDFVVPKNYKLLAVPMCQLHESRKFDQSIGAVINLQTYGSIIAGIPQLLSSLHSILLHLVYYFRQEVYPALP
ncbi:CFIM-25-like protein [Artemisia annua]|uniref:CFIM-25-like protein n=1 Tax=Artemisia annua TaxID=35608 RepID=A0A2U1PN80_ARTAN|nr:CFIM-25-like protein [Artemisia annua]